MSTSETYHLGPDPEGDFANKTRVADAAHEIAEELRTMFNRRSDHLDGILKRCGSYDRGLTLGEVILSLQMALAIYQVELINELAEMHYEPGDEDDEG